MYLWFDIRSGCLVVMLKPKNKKIYLNYFLLDCTNPSLAHNNILGMFME